MIVYNLEEFAIKEMFMPYLTLLVSESGLPNKETNEDEFEKGYEKRVNEIKKEIKKDPMVIINALRNNKKGYVMVFSRLNKMGNITFYKWLQAPFIDEVKKGLCNIRILEAHERGEV